MHIHIHTCFLCTSICMYILCENWEFWETAHVAHSRGPRQPRSSQPISSRPATQTCFREPPKGGFQGAIHPNLRFIDGVW